VNARASDNVAAGATSSQELRLGDTLWLIPGHCDPTVNLYDDIICVRQGKVEAIWPVSARGACL
jgi:D-serine deaminase-like pyridoxal phosphate-dependent protein